MTTPPLAWTVGLAVLAVLLLLALVWSITQRRRKAASPLPSEWSLSPRPVFSTDERRVYRQLREALPHHIVLSKLPLVRFSQPTDPSEVRFWYQLLGSLNVTFAICSANGRVLAAIDLDNERGDSRRAMQIKQSVLAACRVRYLRCPVDHLPSVAELQLMVPQTGGAAARGPHPAPTAPPPRGFMVHPGGSRRRERTTLWQDSGFMQDSFFGVEGRGSDGMPSTFGNLRPGLSMREVPDAPDDVGGVVVDTPVAPVRH